MVEPRARTVARAHDNRRGAAIVTMVLLLVMLDVILLGLIVGAGRDHDLTTQRVYTTQAFYAMEAGINMGVREVVLGDDQDSDGGVGSIATVTVGSGTVTVTENTVGSTTTLTSTGTAGTATRQAQADLEAL